MAIRVASFAGEIPRLIPRLLNENYAQIAQNMKMENGDLLPIRRGRFIQRVPAGAQTIYRHENEWLSWDHTVYAVPGPVATERLYVFGDGVPKIRVDGTILPLAVTRPTKAVAAATSSTIDTDTSFTVLYSYTWVSQYDEESEPADLSNELLVDASATVTLTGFDTPPVGRGITRMRIYRSQTSTSATTQLYFIAERAAIATGFTDVLASNPIQEVIASGDYNAPPDTLTGVVSMPNGILAGFDGKRVYFSEPWRPHAWPEKYVITVDYEIVALGVFGSSVAVLTKGNPYVIQGTAPDSMSSERLYVNLPCLSARGVVDLGYAVAYPSPQGLVTVSAGNGAVVATQSVITMDQWRAMQPETFVSGQFAGRYMTSYDYTDEEGRAQRGMMVFDLSGSQPFIVRASDDADAMYFEVGTGLLFLLRNGQDIYEWDSLSQPFAEYLWRSKKFVGSTYTNYGCILVEGDPALSAAQIAQINLDNAERRAANRALINAGQTGGTIGEEVMGRVAVGGSLLDPLEDVFSSFSVSVYGDGELVWTGFELNKIMRLPGRKQYRTWEIEIRSNQSVTGVQLAYAPMEIAGG